MKIIVAQRNYQWSLYTVEMVMEDCQSPRKNVNVFEICKAKNNYETFQDVNLTQRKSHG